MIFHVLVKIKTTLNHNSSRTVSVFIRDIYTRSAYSVSHVIYCQYIANRNIMNALGVNIKPSRRNDVPQSDTLTLSRRQMYVSR